MWLWCRVEALLKQRTVEAQAAAEVYLFVAEFLQLVSDSHVFQVCVLLCHVATLIFCVTFFRFIITHSLTHSLTHSSFQVH